jgi:hypothetical protein
LGLHLAAGTTSLTGLLWASLALGVLGTAINSGQNVAAAWEAYVPSDPTDNIFQRHWILEQLRGGSGFEKQNGVVIRCNLEYALNPNVKFMSSVEQLTVSLPDTFDNAEYSWKLIGCDVPMTDFERGITSGGAAKFDFEARKIQNMKNTVEEKINQSMFSDGTGTAGKELGGLQLLVSSTPTTGTVGLINRGTYTFFRNQQITGSNTGTAWNNLLAAFTNSYNSCSNGIGEQNPTFAVTTQTVFEGFESLTPTIERLNRQDTSDKLIRGFKGQNFMFKDIPLAYDPFCPSGLCYILNDRNLKFVYMQWMKGEPAVRPADAFYDVFKVLTIGNLITDNPRRLGAVTSCS